MRPAVLWAGAAVSLLCAAGLAVAVAKGLAGHATCAPAVRLCQPDAVLGDPSTPPFDAAPKAVDLDGDGTDELVVQGNDTRVHVFSAEGRVLASLPTTTPPGWGIDRVLNGVEAGVLVPGQPPSLVVTSHAAYVAAWRLDPARSLTPFHLTFTKSWEHRMDACHGEPGMDAKPTLADLDGDGRLEILVQTEEVGFFALRADGSTLWHHCWSGGNAAPVAADLDGDGRTEALFASDDGRVSVLDGATGNPEWTFDASRHARPGSISVAPTAADLDGDGTKEVLFTARHVPSADPATWAAQHMAIFAVRQGELVWVRQPQWANPMSYTRLAVLDADGDGRMDVFGMDWNTVGHAPGHWERLGKANAFRLDAKGNDVWVRPLDAWWSNKDIALGDVDGDGRLDLLANAPGPGGADGFARLDAGTGEVRDYLLAPGWKAMRGVQLLDLRHDGSMQAVFPALSAEAAGGAGRGALLIYDLDATLDTPWNGTP